MANSMTEYGIKCRKENENQIVKNINTFLQKEYEYRKMYRRKDDSISKFQYEYYYCQFLKEQPEWYFDIFPNEDTNGKWKFENREMQWVLYINKISVELYSKKQHEDVDLFFSKLIKAIGFEVIILHKYNKSEERIGNYTDEELDKI